MQKNPKKNPKKTHGYYTNVFLTCKTKKPTPQDNDSFIKGQCFYPLPILIFAEIFFPDATKKPA